MSNTTKSISKQDAENVLRSSFNDVENSLTVNGFLVGKVGRKVELIVSTTNVSDDTETYTFKEGSVSLYALRVIYTTGVRDQLLSAERIS
jgi:hypothetical protein